MQDGESSGTLTWPSPTWLTNDLAASRTFQLGKEIIVPFSVRVRPEIRSFISVSSHDTHIHFLPGRLVDGIERFLSSVDLSYRQFTSNTPLACGVANVGDVLVNVRTVGFVDTSDFVFLHRSSFHNSIYQLFINFPERLLERNPLVRPISPRW